MVNESNPFKDYTNHLAKILQEKNDAYGDSFTKSVDEDGLLVLKIRLGDKLNRISSLIKKDELKENGIAGRHAIRFSRIQHSRIEIS